MFGNFNLAPPRFFIPAVGSARVIASLPSREGGGWLAGIKFNNGLDVGDGVDFVLGRNAHHDALEGVLVHRQPVGHGAAGGAFEILRRNLTRTRVVLHFDGVVHFDRVGGDADLSAVHLNVAMPDQLAGGGAGVSDAKVVDDIVEARLENLKHLLAGHTAALEGAFVHAAELAFHQPVVIPELLLFQQAQAVVSGLAAGFGAVHARAVVAALEIFCRAENGQAEAAADADAGTGVASHLNLRFTITIYDLH